MIQENLFEALVLVELGKEASTLGKNGRLLSRINWDWINNLISLESVVALVIAY